MKELFEKNQGIITGIACIIFGAIMAAMKNDIGIAGPWGAINAAAVLILGGFFLVLLYTPPPSKGGSALKSMKNEIMEITDTIKLHGDQQLPVVPIEKAIETPDSILPESTDTKVQ